MSRPHPTADIDLAELAKGINKPDGRVGSYHAGGCYIGFFDAAVRFVPDRTDSTRLRAFGTIRGGEGVYHPR